LDDDDDEGLERHPRHGDDGIEPRRIDASEARSACEAGESRELADDDEERGRREERQDAGWGDAGDRAQGLTAGSGASGGDQRPRQTNGYWRAADWLACRDGKWRPVEPGTFPLAHGAPARVVRLRGYGNAIVAPLAEEFIRTFFEWRLEGDLVNTIQAPGNVP
jgi:DNA (cytosine-5)-methyltransferase 1